MIGTFRDTKIILKFYWALMTDQWIPKWKKTDDPLEEA